MNNLRRYTDPRLKAKPLPAGQSFNTAYAVYSLSRSSLFNPFYTILRVPKIRTSSFSPIFSFHYIPK